VDLEARVRAHGLPTAAEPFRMLKSMGFSDARLATLARLAEAEVRRRRLALGVRPVFKRIDTCAAEFASPTAYMYSTYERGLTGAPINEAEPSKRDKVVILGGGPNRIGQGIEFDYCCCHACFALSKAGTETIMINCNPETVSTAYDTSDRLYFEPLTAEDAPEAIDLAEDRDRFKALVDRLGLKQPQSGIARNLVEARSVADALGYPVMIRPSYVLGGRAMEIVADGGEIDRYVARLAVTLDQPSELAVSDTRPLLIDRYLADAIEVDVDCLCDGTDTFIAGIMEHIEEAGIHSGDSACSLPVHSLASSIIVRLEKQTRDLALALNVVGLMNVQYAIKGRDIYILEVNPRASRTVPFVAKVIGKPIAGIAARIMNGETLASFKLKPGKLGHVGVKEAVFPFARFPGVDTVLGPEMRSTGEVMGIDRDYAMAFAKSQLGAGNTLPLKGAVFVSVRDADKEGILGAMRDLADIGFRILATRGTRRALVAHGIPCEQVNKVLEGRPHIVDLMKNGAAQLVFNTTEGAKALADSKDIRRTALLNHIPYYTTLAGALAATQAIKALAAGTLGVAPLQSYVSDAS
jgi:carbamoyl-phosphate synthase large subunit